MHNATVTYIFRYFYSVTLQQSYGLLMANHLQPVGLLSCIVPNTDVKADCECDYVRCCLY